MRNVVFVDGCRTPFGKMGGALRNHFMTDLGAIAVKGLIERCRLLERSKVDKVFSGSALHDVRSVNPARYIALAAGLPHDTSASYIEMQCGSAIDCINHAAWAISSGAADVIIAGGAESYSQAFAKFSMSIEPFRLNPPYAVPNRIAPSDDDNLGMVEISDLLAKKWGIGRVECDEFALRSQRKARQAIESGTIGEDIVPVEVCGGTRNSVASFEKDEQPRPDTTLADLARLKTILPDGVTTAGNASGRNDGAAYVLLMSEQEAERCGLHPCARWIGGMDVGVDPRLMGIGPARSNVLLMRKYGLHAHDVDIFECNEAFAAQNLAVIKEMETLLGEDIDREDWNPNGGAIALGHPNGASGARIAISAMRELHRRGGRYAIISSCCGGGLGVSALMERIG